MDKKINFINWFKKIIYKTAATENQTDRRNNSNLNIPRVLVLSLILLSAVYWLLIASNRYVSEAKLLVNSTSMQVSEQFDLSSLVMGNSATAADLRLLREYLRSTDVLEKLDQQLQLRQHYSQWNIDWFSKLWSANTTKENFHAYYLSRVKVEIEEQSGVMLVQAQAYAPKMAQDIVDYLIHEGEDFLNTLGHNLSRTQVEFLQDKVAESRVLAKAAQQELLDYQNQTGIIDPKSQAAALIATLSKLEGEIVALEAQRVALDSFLSQTAPDVVRINARIKALQQQLAKERNKLTSKQDNSLNQQLEQYQQIALRAELARSIHKASLIALEKGQVEASRMLKKVSIVQAPTLPESSLQPRRIYQTLLFIIIILTACGLGSLINAIIKDHRD